MRINRIEKVIRANIEKINPNKKVKLKDTDNKDKLGLSEKALDYKIALDKFKELPEIRQDKVEKLKREISTGIYQADGRKIAKKIIENANFDKRI